LFEDVWVALPVKSLLWAKHRLSACLSPDERRTLVLALLLTTVESVEPFVPAEQMVVVSPDAQVLSWAEARGLCALPQSCRGLNNAVRQVEHAAIRAGAAALLVLLPDLPLVTPADVQQMLLRLQLSHQVVIAPGQRGGTHALAIRPPGWLRFAFGPGSYERHVARALAAGADLAHYESPGLSLDIDTADDLRLALQARPELVQRVRNG
jgi:2-phospho-L-lactate/phosphoenolpyruvate guanylyltransferase